ncbi:MAG: transcription elongation factor GreA [Gammaproteobacteria bacterium]|tara:strand:- start:221 stop:706 length:486 start_codon:yes stop_codon:yes gene_type:complete
MSGLEDREPMTVEGEIFLREELALLITERPKISKEIAAAREFGDLKENAEYHAAKEQQGLAEARIREIESKLSRSQVIDVLSIPSSGKVIFGTTIKLFNISEGLDVSYKIVGEDEADVQIGKISFSSPLAKALIAKEEGDLIKFESPSGVQEYEILSVSHK